MSLLTALNTGTSGMNANSQELAVVGDNIANANTIGFKAGRAVFEDALLQQLLGAPGGGQLGLGTRMQAIQRIMTQGGLTATGVTTDLALEGQGFFVLRGDHGGTPGQYYTRAGQFRIDDSGYLTSLGGLRVQGYTADQDSTILGNLGDLQVGAVSILSRASANLELKGNLSSDSAVPGAFDPANPEETSNYSSSVSIFDSIGTQHNVNVYFRKSGPSAWEFFAMVDGASVQGGSPGILTQIASGTLTYDNTGRLTDVTQSSNFNPVASIQPQPLTFNFGDPISTGGTGVGGITQSASPSGMTFTRQDGNASGSLADFEINSKGQIFGYFTNGTQRILGQVAVADFAAPDRLNLVGSNLGAESSDSGQPTIGRPAEGGRAQVTSKSLEQSNVDLANEFVRMIAAQRSFQANSKTITTADQLLGELMTIKR